MPALSDLMREAQPASWLELVPDAMVIAGGDGRIVLVNRQLEVLFGQSREELVGQPIEVLIPERYRVHHSDHRARYFVDPRARSMGEGTRLHALRKDGSEFPAEISLSPMQVDGQTWVTAAIRDISEHVRSEAELREAKETAQVADAAKTEFLAMVSHEVRTPLTSLLGFADLLLDPHLRESDRLNYAQIIRRNSEHLLAMLNDILDVSKVEAGKIEIERIAFSPAALLSELRALMQVRATHKGLSFVVEQEAELPALVRSDPTRVRQVIMNLVSNAVKFTARGGVRVTAAYQRDGTSARGQLIVRVSDTGAGIDSAQLERILAPFQQADPSTRPRSTGSGLGLSLCAPIAHALGGTLTVETQAGRGSTFTLAVPAESVEPSESIDPSIEHDDTPTSELRRTLGGRVLLVVDDSDSGVLIGALLRQYDIAVVVVNDTVHALDQVTAAATLGDPFDVVVVSVQLLGLDGTTAISRLRAAGYVNAIVALGAHAAPAERARCLNAGCADYLSKPIRRGELLRKLGRFVQSQAPKSVRPSIAPPAPPVGSGARANSAPGSSQPCVLVIDDSADIQALIATRLRSEHVRVQSAGTGREGLDAAMEGSPDLVLLDVELPDLSGLALCRALKADPRTTNIPVLFLTGAEDTATKTAAFELGAVDYITKPFDPIELRARVRAALRTKKYQDLLAARAQVDALTGLWNRGYFETRLRDELSAALRHKHSFCVAILDLDHFKNINDSHGHPFGDHVLQAVSTALQKSLRTSDVACRYGGEEFAVILPDTNATQGVFAAERIRRAIESLELQAREQTVEITVSVGVATFDAEHSRSLAISPSALVEAADAALYRAKHAGRNRVMLSTGIDP